MEKIKIRFHAIRSVIIPVCLLGCLLPFSGNCAENITPEAFEEEAEKPTLEELTNTTVEKAAEKAAQKATDKVVEQAAEKAAEKAVKKAVEKAKEKTTTEVVEKAAAIAVEKAADAAAEKEELKANRPEEWRGTTKVNFEVFLLDVDSIDDANQSFMANVFVRLSWKDARLANLQGDVRQIRLEDAWHPQVIIANRQGLLSRSLPEVLQVDPDGTITYRQRYTGGLSQPLGLSNFPMDRHTFSIQFVSAAYKAHELEFIPVVSEDNPAIKAGMMASTLSLPDWEVLRYEAMVSPYHPNKEINSAGFVFRFEAKRYVEYYLWQIVLPLSIVVMMSWSAFWIQRGERGVRMGVATSSILTLIANRFVLASLIPRLPYMTRMDYFTVGCTLLVFVALIGVVVTGYLSTINRDIMARRTDLILRGLFPVIYLLLLGWFMSDYLSVIILGP